jgi:FtsH-binding integral membrane protein
MLCAAVCAVLTFKLPFYSGHLQTDPAKGITIEYLAATSKPIWLLIIAVVLTVGILVNIFNYKKRKQQLLVTIVLILVSLLNIVVYWVAHNQYIDGTFSLSALLALAIPVFLILATRGITKDEKLVKSADRLR